MLKAFYGIGDIAASTRSPAIFFLPGLLGIGMLVVGVATGSTVVFPVGIALVLAIIAVATPSQRRLHLEEGQVEVFSWFRSTAKAKATAEDVVLEVRGRSWSWWVVGGERLSVPNRGSEALFDLMGIDPTAARDVPS